MKRYLCYFVAIGLLLSGCGAQPANEPPALQSAQPPAGEQPALAPADALILEGEGEEAGSRPSFFANNRVYGRVQSIVGNEVVLELGEVDEEAFPEGGWPQNGEGGAPNADRTQPEDWTPPEGGEGQRRQGGGAAPEGRTPPEGGARPGGGTRGEAQQGNGGTPPAGGQTSGRQGGRRAVEITYTGETGTYLIPVGLPIGQGDYSSITAGMVLRLTLDEDDTVTGVFILSQ